MKAKFAKGLVLGAVVSSVTLISSVALAGSGIGGVFNLGKTNTVNASTVLTGSTSGGGELNVRNNSSAPQAVGLVIHTANNTRPPLVINSSKKVDHLNADLLDGVSSEAFLQGGGLVLQARFEEPNPSGNGNILLVPDLGSVEASCGTSGYRIFWRNRTTGALDMWYTRAGVTHYAHETVQNSGDYLAFDITTDELISQQVGSPGHTTTITTSAHWSAGGCVFHSQAVTQ